MKWFGFAGCCVFLAATGCSASKRDFDLHHGGNGGLDSGGSAGNGAAGRGGSHQNGGASSGGKPSGGGATNGGDSGNNGDAGTTADGGTGGVGGVPETGGAGGTGGEVIGNVCSPNQPVCDGNRATTCNAQGTGYSATGIKCSSTQTCVAGACENQECAANTNFCSANSVRKCAADGLSSAVVTACTSSQYCEVASATCKAGVCAPNQPACDGTRATLCTANGDGYVAGGTVCKASETCDVGVCKPQVCTPSQGFCQGQDVKSCSANGLSSNVVKTCSNQTCVASAGAADCKGVCAPGQQDCSNNGVRTCDATGQYGTASKCTNKTCVASGTTASCVGSCEPGQAQCSGNGTQACGANGVWGAATPCAATTPVCVSNTCQSPLSCNGLTVNCGSSESCCTSPVVTGGSYSRNNDSNYPATVSSFRLDKYEVTVGRFRKFVTAVVGGWRPTAGSGKHSHLNSGSGLKNSGATGYEPGWDAAGNSELYSAKADWDTNLMCDAAQQTWTSAAGLNETLPISCVLWNQAAAFCIWDGGFLPSEVEGNYAACGGNQQRYYPWSSPASATNIDCSYANYFGVSGETDFCVSPGLGANSPVGATPKGNGRYGQADLGGNVDEWRLDYYQDYTATCTDCAALVPTNVRVIEGGDLAGKSFTLANNYRDRWFPSVLSGQFGFRCARTP